VLFLGYGYDVCGAFFVFPRGIDLLLCFVWVIRGPRVGTGQFSELVQLARTASSAETGSLVRTDLVCSVPTLDQAIMREKMDERQECG
jgi:hypothetical protein